MKPKDKQEPLFIKKPRKKKVLAKISGDNTARNILKGFDKETRIVGLTNGAFSLISLIQEVLKIVGKSKVTLSTWSAGFYDISAFKELQESGLMTDVRIIIDWSFKTRLNQYATHLLELFNPEKIRTTKTHSKFVLIENSDWKVVILSSMNLNENIRSENFDVQNDPEVFDMLNSFANHLFKTQAEGLVSNKKEVTVHFNNFFDSSEDLGNFDLDFDLDFDIKI